MFYLNVKRRTIKMRGSPVLPGEKHISKLGNVGGSDTKARCNEFTTSPTWDGKALEPNEPIPVSRTLILLSWTCEEQIRFMIAYRVVPSCLEVS